MLLFVKLEISIEILHSFEKTDGFLFIVSMMVNEKGDGKILDVS
jgi:hypothetical protein